jgi:hypothetical protein
MCFEITPERITAIASCVGATGVCLLYWQVRADHERARKEKAIELMIAWSQGLHKSGSAARKLGEKLDAEQSRKLYRNEVFSIGKDKKDFLVACFNANEVFQEDNNGINLSPDQTSVLRWHIISYLNLLESILSAKRHNVADRDMIKEEFKYLISPEDGHSVLQAFRNAAGNTDFPAIGEFAREIEAEKNKIGEGKKPAA